MARATLVVEADLNEDGTYEVDLTTDTMSAEIFYGREDEQDSADSGRLSLELNNSHGSYTPRMSDWGVGAPVRIRTTDPSAVPLFTGWVTQMNVNPEHKRQSVELVATDRMEILARQLISTGLMREQYTGVIVNRLLDAAEGELITNPKVEASATGWVTVGGAGVLRDTTNPFVLEEPAALAITGSSADTGGEYTGFTESLAGKKVTYSVYARPVSDSIGTGNIKIRLADSTGTIATSADTEIPYGRWTRVEVTGTYAIGGTGQVVRALAATSGGATNWRIGAQHMTFSAAAYPRNVDRGDSTLSYFGPFRRPAAECIEEVRDNELGGLFYLDPGGTAVYEQRTRRWATTTAVAAINETMSEMDFSDDIMDRFSGVELTYQQYQRGRVGTVVWAAEMAQSLALRGTGYTGGTVGTTTVYAPYGFIVRDVIVPVGTTDWLANTSPDGEGGDVTNSSITMSARGYGEGMKLDFLNSSGRDMWLTKLAIRGTPIRTASDNPLMTFTPGTVYNLIENPSAEVNTTGIRGSSDSTGTSPTVLARSATYSRYGTASVSAQGTSGAPLNAIAWTKYDGSKISVTAGSMYTLSMAARLVNTSGTAGVTGHTGMYWYNSGGTLLTNGSHSFGSGTVSGAGGIRIIPNGTDWARIFFHARAPASTVVADNAVYALPNFEETAGWGTGQVLYFDGVMFNNGGLEDYIDGNQPGCSWTGTANQSSSYRENKVHNVLEHSYDWQDKEGAISSWGQWLADRYSHPKERINVTLKPRNSTQVDQMITRKVSDRVQLVNEGKTYSTKINGDYFIESVRHRIAGGGFLHNTTWAVSPVGAEYAMPFWILDTSRLALETRPAP